LAVFAFVFLLYVIVSFAVQVPLKTWREARILELYRYQAFPILEIQWEPTDAQCFKRSQAHREKLVESGNEIFKQGIIHVEEIYYNDALFGIAEPPEEQAIRRADYIKQYLNDWGLRQSKDNNRFLKQWVYDHLTDFNQEDDTDMLREAAALQAQGFGLRKIVAQLGLKMSHTQLGMKLKAYELSVVQNEFLEELDKDVIIVDHTKIKVDDKKLPF
jgi:hypothetical protein